MNTKLSFSGTSTSAAQTLKTLFSTPVIGAPLVKDASGAINQFGSLFTSWAGVPIYTEKYEENLKSELGKQILIRSTGGIEQITDNVAPSPRKWTIDGYLQGVALSSLGALSTILSTVVSAALLQLQKNYLRYLRNTRSAVSFRTAEGESTYAFIEDLSFFEDPAIANVKKLHVVMTEMNVLQLGASGQQTTSIPAVGSWYGSAASIGAISAVALLTSSFETSMAQLDTESGTTTTNEEKRAAVSAVVSASEVGTATYYAPMPATSIISTSDKGVVSYTQNTALSVQVGGARLSLTLRLEEETKIWHVLESYVIDGEEVYAGQSRLLFNSLLHADADYYSYTLLSDNPPVAPEAPDVRLVEPDPSDLDAYSKYVVNRNAWASYEALVLSYPTRVITAFANAILVVVQK